MDIDRRKPLICTKCDAPLSDENWSPSAQRKSRYQCRTCVAAYQREWLAQHPGYNKKGSRLKPKGPREEICTTCKIPLTDDNWVPYMKRVRRFQCSECRRAYQREYHSQHPKDYDPEQERKWTWASWERAAWLRMLEGRAKKLRVPFSLTAADTQIPHHCPVLGLEFERHIGSGPRANSPTIDRMVPELGYVPGNVLIVSHRANTLKGNRTPEELYHLAYKNKTASTPQEQRIAVYEWVTKGILGYPNDDNK